MRDGYRIYYYDSWSETFEDLTTCDTLQQARQEVNKSFLLTTDTDITAVYISWFEDGIECEEQYVLTDVENGKRWERA